MNIRILTFLTILITAFGCARSQAPASDADAAPRAEKADTAIVVGAERTDVYLPMLRGKRVALCSNHTGMVGGKHTLDLMLENGIDVFTIFSPEHGFRGTADAGEHVSSSVDPVTGISISSLYNGGKRGPAPEVMDSIDVVVFDIQDVGLRFYTYYCTMLELMNAAARHGKEFVVLDRPNPNGMYVDGPLLDMKYQSGVGRLPIPIVHGMTLGELALMINGEGWLEGGRKVPLQVVPCLGYDHSTRYELPIAPSPNLRDMHAIYLYPSTCFFEGTPVSLGRGTDVPFEIYGHPDMKGRTFEFTPQSVPGAKNPPLLGRLCRGVDLRGIPDEQVIADGVNLEYVIDAYRDLGSDPAFFTRFFDLLAGGPGIRQMIMDGKSAAEIKESWQPDVLKFRAMRRPYLLYKDTE